MASHNRRDQIEAALFYLRERSIKNLASKQVKKIKELEKKKVEATVFFFSLKKQDEGDRKFKFRSTSLLDEYQQQEAFKANAADKLSYEYQFQKKILWKNRLGGKIWLERCAVFLTQMVQSDGTRLAKQIVKGLQKIASKLKKLASRESSLPRLLTT
jgi:hypothetical protein